MRPQLFFRCLTAATLATGLTIIASSPTSTWSRAVIPAARGDDQQGKRDDQPKTSVRRQEGRAQRDRGGERGGARPAQPDRRPQQAERRREDAPRSAPRREDGGQRDRGGERGGARSAQPDRRPQEAQRRREAAPQSPRREPENRRNAGPQDRRNQPAAPPRIEERRRPIGEPPPRETSPQPKQGTTARPPVEPERRREASPPRRESPDRNARPDQGRGESRPDAGRRQIDPPRDVRPDGRRRDRAEGRDENRRDRPDGADNRRDRDDNRRDRAEDRDQGRRDTGPGAPRRGRQDFGQDDRRRGDWRRSLGDNRIRINNRDVSIARGGYEPSFSRHNWYRGHWFGDYGWRGNRGDGDGWGYYGPNRGWGWWGGRGWRPLGWGLGAWGLGSLIYSSGYLPYTNPYYGDFGGTAVYDYAQPIPVVYSGEYDTTLARSTETLLSEAMESFRRNDYETALDLVNQAVAQSPDDAAAHEFRSLVLFAKGDYRQSAATIHSVLAVGPGWDWPTLRSMYPDVAIYTAQLRGLEQFVRDEPRDASGRFLLAYHYLTTNYPDAAAAQLRPVVEIVPDDRVALDLLRMLEAPPDDSGTVEEPAPRPFVETSPPERPLDEQALIGTWEAARDGGLKFELTIGKDGQFSWRHWKTGDTAPTEFSGQYSTEGDVLVLTRPDGGSLVAEVSDTTAKAFRFRLVSAPPDDRGLEFRRV